jgi:four helix bundle protein
MNGPGTEDGGREKEELRTDMDKTYKFQKLDVYQFALGYVKAIYRIAQKLPEKEKYNLKSQISRAATSVVLNIAEGSTGQSDLEQKRFLGLSLRSYLETIACLDLIEQFEYLAVEEINDVRQQGHELFIKLIAFRRALK